MRYKRAFELFTRTFPFGGNGNIKTTGGASSISSKSSHVPSRLEGMETIEPERPQWSASDVEVHTYLPVWRELKLLLQLLPVLSVESSHVPSRLEGMETEPAKTNKKTNTFVHTYLPVWRELKPYYAYHRHLSLHGSHVPSRLEGIETANASSAKCFSMRDLVHTYLPVWRELKQ